MLVWTLVLAVLLFLVAQSYIIYEELNSKRSELVITKLKNESKQGQNILKRQEDIVLNQMKQVSEYISEAYEERDERKI